jgi:hypothetical protein
MTILSFVGNKWYDLLHFMTDDTGRTWKNSIPTFWDIMTKFSLFWERKCGGHAQDSPGHRSQKSGTANVKSHFSWNVHSAIMIPSSYLQAPAQFPDWFQTLPGQQLTLRSLSKYICTISNEAFGVLLLGKVKEDRTEKPQQV